MIRPRSLAGENSPALGNVGLVPGLSRKGEHATAALADFRRSGEGWVWNRRSGARFRILQYDGCLCPEIDLPIATDDVIREIGPRLHPLPLPLTLPPPSPSEDTASDANQRLPHPRRVPKTGGSRRPLPHRPAIQVTRQPEAVRDRHKDNVVLMTPSSRSKGDATTKKFALDHVGLVDTLSPERYEISLDELKKRLSRLIGVSLGELERLFEKSRFG